MTTGDRDDRARLETARRLRFADFELDLVGYELRRCGAAVRLQRQPCRVLALLASRAGELVTREQLRRAIWGQEVWVNFDQGLNFCIKEVRAALGDSAARPRFVETLPRRGYRFVHPVAPVAAGSRTVAVLAFDDAGAGVALRRLARAVVDGLARELAGTRPERLAVLSGPQTRRFRAGDAVATVADALGADCIVEGTVSGSARRARLAIRLLRVGEPCEVWTGEYHATLDEPAPEQRLAKLIAADLARAIAPE